MPSRQARSRNGNSTPMTRRVMRLRRESGLGFGPVPVFELAPIIQRGGIFILDACGRSQSKSQERQTGFGAAGSEGSRVTVACPGAVAFRLSYAQTHGQLKRLLRAPRPGQNAPAAQSGVEGEQKKRPLFITTASKRFATAQFLRRRTRRKAISPPRPISAEVAGSGTV